MSGYYTTEEDEALFDERFEGYCNRAKQLFPTYTEDELKEVAF
jgi:hypothetical protein